MPNDDTDRRVLQESRARLAEATRASRQAIRDEAESASALKRLLRMSASDDDRVRAAREEHARRLAAVERARGAVARAGQDLSANLNSWLADEAASDVARLSAAFPVVLFPVRLETRFIDRELKIRVYPDAVLAHSHDPLLTEAERDAGIAFWRKAWAGDERQAWRELLRQAPACRAAWIVRIAEPVNLPERPAGVPAFPELQLRAATWDRSPQVTLLPDRWIVLAYRGGVEVRRAVSRPVQEPLAVGFDPHTAPGEGVQVSSDGLELDADLAWAVDFARAEEAGMALRVPLDEQDLQTGFDRLLVMGIKSSLSPEDGRDALAELFEGHHYSGGLALLAQGTPTNNTETTASAYPPPDPDGTRSFAVERGPALSTEDGDGARLMRALGLPAGLVAHVEGASRREQAAAGAMNQALWPVTLGYFLGQMMAPHVSGADIGLARRYYVSHVRGRGPLPAFRVRGQPYGVLPVSSLERWQPRREADSAERRIVALLRRLRGVWQAQVAQVPRIGRTADADGDLLAVMGMDASAREVRVRKVHGPDFQRNLFQFLGFDIAQWESAQVNIAFPMMILIGFPNFRPRILRMSFADTAGRFRFPFVAPAPLSEETGLEAAFGFDYIRWIREAGIGQLRQEQLPDGRQVPATLLYRMLRHARLTELARVAVEVQIAHGMATAAEQYEPELIGVAEATAGRPTVWQRFVQPVPELTGAMSLGEFLETRRDTPETTPLREYEEALEALEGLPTAELERVFSETLDLCSHRFDAWVTSLAGKRLMELRESNLEGAYTGAFGWVEGLVPRPAAASAGYIQAPSMQHAAAAAILRNGHLTRSGSQGDAYAVNLSSGRVRMAISALDTVREGQSAGALFGYQFERALHDRHLDWFIEPLRRRFPLVANKSGNPDLEGPPDAIAARNVVDGLVLRTAWRKGSLDLTHPDFNRAGTPPTDAERAVVEAELTRLDDAVDAVADLLTAESVFQLVEGNTADVNASLDAMAKGLQPPDPAIAKQPRSGIPLTHRVALVLGGVPLSAEGWGAEATPRALAEPYVDGWAGSLLGDPRTVLCRVRRESGDPEPVTLAQLGLRPIDILALAQAVSDAVSELDQLVAEAAGVVVGQITYERDPAWSRHEIRSFPEIFEVARAANRLLEAARPLKATDLLVPDTTTGLPGQESFSSESVDRAAGALSGLRQVSIDLRQALQSSDIAALRPALRAASLYGVSGALAPVTLELGASVLAGVERRVAEAESAGNPRVAARAIFGPDFPFLPGFTPSRPDELAQALAAGPVVSGGPLAPARWLYQAARVRPPLAKWRELALMTGVLGTHKGGLDVVQLPHRPDLPWVARPFADNAPPPNGVLSIVLHRLATPGVDQTWAGLLVDEWNEVIPEPKPTTGIALHYDTPGAEPPQAVLLAVPADNAPAWSLDGLIATLNETLDLAKLRAVDAELLGAIGQLTPAIYLAANEADDAVTTRFTAALVADTPTRAAEV